MTLPDHIRVLERGWLSSNNIVFLDPDCPTVVDTGYGTHAEQTLALVNEALQGQPLRRILNTHLHSDHAGGNAILQAHHDCETWIPPGLQEAVTQWDESRLSYAATGQACARFRHDRVMQPGQTLDIAGDDWLVLSAAGHDNDMLMLWCERSGILISADALWENGFGVIFPELMGESGFAEQQATLDTIAQLSPRLVIPGHGAPFTDVKAALASAHSRIRWLADNPRRNTDNAIKALLAFKLLAARQMTVADVAALLRNAAAMLDVVREHYPVDPDAMAQVAAEQMVKLGVARRDGDVLISQL
ncbi:MBL fold metallo-hydrolase [Aquabacterium sp.]|uniref:MBL fold metallo-hydrolase n=1 Tax=Aquabacterium sp. TaxID=1872578 RepID=UPI002E304C7B|nr:MBL fold metallo-hydrolase [Aquabacterium sp.]HEX5310846.1 MBL fold metallo-hydrolase [Aquabacterium sp.]